MAERSLQPFYPELSRIGTETRIGAGAMLWHEGDPGDSVVLLLDGTLEVLLEAGDDSEEVILRTLEAGALVGELASTDGRSRSAAVRARTSCRILKILAPDFRNLLRRRPDMLEELYWLQVERVRSLTRQVTKTHQQAITDVLTRLYNYGFFRERLEIELERARQTGDLISVVMFDIDHFKHYNDTNGHSEGNVVLVQVSAILKNAGRRGDIPARYGGEELVALLYGATRGEAARFAEHVRKDVEAYAFKGGSTQPLGKVTVSAGVATYPLDATGDAALIKAADQNLYKAKEAGRNRVVTNEAEPA